MTESPPELTDAHNKMQLADSKMAGGDHGGALLLYEDAVVAQPHDDVVKRYHLAVTKLGAYQRAEPVLVNAGQANPESRAIQYLLIDALLKQAKFKKAFAQIKKTMALFGVESDMLHAALHVKERMRKEKDENAEESKNAVSLCMIVKDEENFLAKCLHSVEPIVNEVIVVDTGSKDSTKDIARVFDAKVFDFTWCDDFSAARNFSISKASGDWILVLDADEVISTIDHDRLLKLTQNPDPFPVAYAFETRNYTRLANRVGFTTNEGSYHEEAGVGWMPSTKVRLFPNRPGIVFTYPVHELLDPVLEQQQIPIEESRIPIHHYGKLNEEKRGAKSEKYYRIGLKKIDELEGNPFAVRELAVQAGELERYDEALGLWQRVVSLQPQMPEAYINMASACWQLGRYEEALAQAREASSLAPHVKETRFNEAISLLLLGRADESIPILQRLVERTPDYLSARFFLGSALCCAKKADDGLPHFAYLRNTNLGPGLEAAFHDLAGRFVSAEKTDYAKRLMETVVEAESENLTLQNFSGGHNTEEKSSQNTQKPNETTEEAQICLGQGNALTAQGRLEDAIESYQKALDLKPDHPDILLNLGMAYYQIQDYENALSCFQKSLETRPDFAEAYNGMAVSHKALGNLEKAVSCCQKAISLKPEYTNALCNLGGIFKDLKRLDEAIAAYEKALAADPQNAEVCYNMAMARNKQNCSEEAIDLLENALRIRPNFPKACFLMADILKDADKIDEAASWYQKGLDIDPENVNGLSSLGTLYGIAGLIGNALYCFKKGIEIDSKDSSIRNNCANAYLVAGNFKKSIELFRNSLELNPNDLTHHSNLLFSSQYDPRVNDLQLFFEAKKWEKGRPKMKLKTFHHAAPSAINHRLRIGYVSPDFRHHSVSWFFLPLLLRHDHAKFEIFCYSNVKRPDKVTTRIQNLSDHWRTITDLNDHEAAEIIYEDGIDILVDLAGHSGNNRLGVFLYKPAPVQVTWLGYPGTTGLEVIDYRITDAIADPEGISDDCHTEKLIRLKKGFLCYMPHESAPEISSLPAFENEAFTFGCFNNLPKVNEIIIKVWAEILQRLPDARMLMKTKALKDPLLREHYGDLFQKYSVANDRILMLPDTPTVKDHLDVYSQVDISLDTFPYNGTTTTCEALWMGTPVITLCGNRHSARVGSSILTQIGFRNLIAESHEEYIEKAVNLSKNTTALSEMRKTMRTRMRESALCDAAGFARAMEKTYNEIYAKWCQKNTAC